MGLEQAAVANCELATLDDAGHATTGYGLERPRLDERESSGGGALNQRGRERMLAAALETGTQAQELRFAEVGPHDNHRVETRVPLGECSGLVDDERIHALQALQDLRIAHQHSGTRTAPHAHHDRHGRGEAERTRAGDEQHRDRVDQRKAHRRRRTEERPGEESGNGRRDHPRNKPG